MVLEGSEDFRFQRAIDFLVDAGADIAEKTTWLDLGCHQGQFLKKLISSFGLRALGSDDWDPALKSATDAGWEYRQADLDRELPWSEPVDVVSALEVLEHMIDTDGFLQRVHYILKPGGWTLISTPNINSLRNRVTVPLGRYPTGLEYRTVIHHVRLYNPTVLAQHLYATRFTTNVQVRGISFLPLQGSFGIGRISRLLADRFPSLCNNILAITQKPLA
jgi:2-polyprenyl-3-methyl-5-hydroxy-6-metoxy-1,4-benzoquinol methylase